MTNYKQEIQKLKEKIRRYEKSPNFDIEIYYDDDFANIQRFKARMRYNENKVKLQTWKQALTSEIEFLEKLDKFVMGKIRIGSSDSAIGLLNKNMGEIREQIKQLIAELEGALE